MGRVSAEPALPKEKGIPSSMVDGVKYSVILPTYNERQNLPIMVWMLLRQFDAIGAEVELVIVDDASPDGTLAVAKQLQTLYGSDRIVLRPRAGKLGLGTAYGHGLAGASGDWVILMDSDFSHHPKDIPAMLTAAGTHGYDLVSGNRYLAESVGGGVWGWNLMRKMTSRVANYIAAAVLAPANGDLTGSFRLYRRDVIEKLITVIESTGYGFQMEAVIRAKSLGYHIGEVPITFVDRQFGDSKMDTVKETVLYLRGVWQLWWI